MRGNLPYYFIILLLINFQIRRGKKMDKTLKNTIFSITLLIACSGLAVADSDAFTPLNFDDTSYGIIRSSTTSSVSQQVGANAAQQVQQQQAGNENLQNAILQLDNAQVDVRNQLLDCKTKFAEIDAQYRTIKQERDAVNKQVKDIEKKIKEIDKTKEKIRKNMI